MSSSNISWDSLPWPRYVQLDARSRSAFRGDPAYLLGGTEPSASYDGKPIFTVSAYLQKIFDRPVGYFYVAVEPGNYGYVGETMEEVTRI